MELSLWVALSMPVVSKADVVGLLKPLEGPLELCHPILWVPATMGQDDFLGCPGQQLIDWL